jgi:hypothetical protein
VVSCLRKLPRSERDRDGCVKDKERGVGGAVRFYQRGETTWRWIWAGATVWAAYVEGHVVGLYTRLGSAWAYRSWDWAQNRVNVSGLVFFFLVK